MTPVEQKRAAKAFVERWENLPCVEEEHSRSFWIELLQDVLGVANATHVLEFERKVKGRKIDVFYEDMGILVEMKSRGVSLDEATIRSRKVGFETPYQQASWYGNNLPYSIRPRWIITCNFDEFRIYDKEEANDQYVSILLSELPEQIHLLSFFLDKRNSRLVREKELSIQAGELVGKLYAQLSQQYKNIETDTHEQRSLNVLIVRLVFLLYAEDSGLLHEKDALLNYLKRFPADQMRQAVIDLFAVLDTPVDKRDQYLPDYLLAFPYVNGGLFGNDDIVVPQFTDQIRLDLLLEASQNFDWSGISPTIFGAAFESTLNPETRRSGGMHYTSIENIHKVIDPLFLDSLKTELTEIEGEKVEKKRKMLLKAFQKKLASINILDPACGSGNFLTESYLSLRKLENRVLESLQSNMSSMFGAVNSEDLIKVSISQFYGIEINDFAVSVAKTALWIAEEQMMEATQEILLCPFDFLPLKSNSNIHEGNALRMDWNDVLPAGQCTYICGNPPFIGYSNHSKSQQEDRALYFGKVKTVDYVACWYKKSTEYMLKNKNIHAALVSTNSICQGQQVEPIWKPLFNQGILINFAWQSFVWNNEAANQAHVHVVIVGFSYDKDANKKLFDNNDKCQVVANINGYLQAAPSVFVAKRTKPLCNVSEMAQGFKPAENGTLLLSGEEYDSVLKEESQIAKWIRPFSMGANFIKGERRYCLWLNSATVNDIDSSLFITERVNKCKEWRSSQVPTGDAYKLRNTPHLLRPCGKFKDRPYIGVPKVSSERRSYIPLGFVTNGMIPGDMLYFVSMDSLYIFGVLMSQFHNAWMRVVAGRLEMRYRYANTIVYNNFVWPGVIEHPDVPVEEAVAVDTRNSIEQCAQAVLDAREAHPDKSLADLYDPDKMPTDLLAAHKALDAAVEAAYGVGFNGDEEKIVAHLFKLYAQLAEGKH